MTYNHPTLPTSFFFDISHAGNVVHIVGAKTLCNQHITISYIGHGRDGWVSKGVSNSENYAICLKCEAKFNKMQAAKAKRIAQDLKADALYARA